MGPLVLADTGYFIARLTPRDQWHEKARKVKVAPRSAVTTSLVVNETVSLLQVRGFSSAALAFLQQIREGEDVRIVLIDPALQAQAWDLFARYGPSGATIVDCASFAVMRNLSIKKALTFDTHFRSAGFEILR